MLIPKMRLTAHESRTKITNYINAADVNGDGVLDNLVVRSTDKEVQFYWQSGISFNGKPAKEQLLSEVTKSEEFEFQGSSAPKDNKDGRSIADIRARTPADVLKGFKNTSPANFKIIDGGKNYESSIRVYLYGSIAEQAAEKASIRPNHTPSLNELNKAAKTIFYRNVNHSGPPENPGFGRQGMPPYVIVYEIKPDSVVYK